MEQVVLWTDWRMEDEAVLDRGASFLKHVCDEEEVEGHHTIYIGVHVPKSYRRRRRHRRRPGHKEKKEKISENYSDKSDVENADETSSSILKPLSNSVKQAKLCEFMNSLQLSHVERGVAIEPVRMCFIPSRVLLRKTPPPEVQMGVRS
ncbi:hypothetical protein Q9966_000605 [Columba livia]|nr:hypothetical protein Q9966_000605 [Columba livia]